MNLFTSTTKRRALKRLGELQKENLKINDDKKRFSHPYGADYFHLTVIESENKKIINELTKILK